VTIDCGLGSSYSDSSSGFKRLRARLRHLDFKTFQRCVWLWLGASGYRHMRFLGRRGQRGGKQSGPDFIVQIGVPDGIRIGVQVRHWKSPVSKRAVDELRGHMLRERLSAGMIVASSPSSRAALLAAAEYPGRPVRIVSVDRLAESMMAMELGVVDGPFGICLDERFFRSVKHLSMGPISLPRRQPKPNPSPGILGTPDGGKLGKGTLWMIGMLLAMLVAAVWIVGGTR
jgi:hypothetical protein